MERFSVDPLSCFHDSSVPMKRLFLVTFALLFTIGTVSVSAQSTAEGPSVRASGFSQALDVANNHVFVGEPNNLHTPGRVYVFGTAGGSGWTQQTHLEAEDGAVGDGFGAALDVSGSTLVVGAPSADAAYVFQRREGEWRQTSRLAPAAADSASGFGRSVTVADNRLFVAAQSSEQAEVEGGGAVYVYHKESGGWSESAVVSSGVIPSESQFGRALAASKGQLLVSAPAYEGGVVAVFQRDEGGWNEVQLVEARDFGDGARFGRAVQWTGEAVLVGAPRAYDATGAVRAFTYNAKDTTWTEETTLLPFDGSSRHLFGGAIAHDDSDLWVGAPGADKATGALYRFDDGDVSWARTERIRYPEAKERNQFAGTLSAGGSTLAVGLPGADYGAGSMAVYSVDDGSWSTTSPLIPSKEGGLTAMTGETRSCDGESVSDFSCKGVDLHAFLPISDIGGDRGIELNDVWGWTDPETGTEYALVGRTNGTAFVDVSDPTNPVYVGELPLTEGARVNSWRDIKVYKDHAYVVADNAGDHGMQIFDLTQLRDVQPSEMPVTFEQTAHYDRVNSVHNIVINKETGYAYAVGSSGGGETCGGGLHMINIENPTEPEFEGCFADESTGRAGTGYSHDAQCVIYEGPDERYQGREICIGYNETAISVADVTDKDNPKAISTASYPDHAYIHQGWFTEDQRYIYQNDELDELQGKVDSTRTLVWDMSDLENPTLVKEHIFPVESTDHNLYIQGSTMYQSNYKSGLRLLDVSDPENPEEYAHFDTFPPNSESGFQGTWSNYPFFESGTIVVSGIGEGLFVLEESRQEL